MRERVAWRPDIAVVSFTLMPWHFFLAHLGIENNVYWIIL
ncbi:Uncharacterized protein YR821_3251 [Yersinia ruckeri]|nr:hypothetical protein yruck0001_940 [Yersinia ruckeri ATCC 29473]QTD78167.1 Uncharacterized protein YR821_3251 [Yersinia ruckeri]